MRITEQAVGAARRVALVLGAVLALSPPAAFAAPPTLSCRYVEAGVPGPLGNLLEVKGTGDAAIGRDGSEITVSLAAGNGFRIEERIDCTGAVPTVTTVDRIAYTAPSKLSQVLIDERGGRFEPGASDEPGGEEIELSVDLSDVRDDRPYVHVLGTPGADSVTAGNLPGRRVGVNLNWGAEGAEKDADLTIALPGRGILKIDGYEGVDRLSGAGGTGFAGSVSLSPLVLAGSDGNDVLIGGPRRDFLEGDGGNDIVIGRGGGDQIYGGSGRDRVQAGRGNDQIRGGRASEDDFQFDLYAGGAGNDYISARHGGSDRVLCGSGFDDAWVDPYDEWNDCDDVAVAKR